METQEPLPTFPYHPDPVSTGVVELSNSPCLCCNRIRGYIYTGPAHSGLFHHLSGSICPWCIADGAAARRFKATFNDSGNEEVDNRTPGFDAWQTEEWLTCCNGPAVFLGLAGARELRKQFRAAMPAVKEYLADNYDVSGDELKEFLDGLKKDDQPTAYIFRCPNCQEYMAYVDQT